MNRHKLWVSVLIIIISVLYIRCGGPTEKSLSNTAVNVEVQQAVAFDGSEVMSYSGTIEESESVSLSFSSLGNVARVLVSEGDLIHKGQLLATLNDETYKNAYEMSLASQKQAEDAYKRLLPMYKNGNLPEIKLVEIETALQQAKSATAIAKKGLDDCKLYSPVEGIVGRRSIDPGMSAMPNLSSISIVKIDKVFACVAVSENEISSIKKGSKARIKISALSESEFTGIVKEIGVMADPIAHTYKVKIEIVNNNRLIKPGMICSITLDNINVSAGLLITGSAVLADEQGRNFVYAVNQNKAVRKYVKTGKLLKSGVEITGGINEGEQIVVAGQQKLVDNSLIHIVNR